MTETAQSLSLVPCSFNAGVYVCVCERGGILCAGGPCLGDLCPVGSLLREVSVQRVFVQGVSVQGVFVAGGLCPGGLYQ